MATSQQNLLPVKHGRDTRGVAPASDVVGHDDTRGTSLPTHPAAFGHMVFFFFFFSRLALTRLRLGLICAELGQLGPYRPKLPIQDEIQKKKKKVQNSLFEINIKNPTSAHFTQTPNFNCLSSHFVSHSSLCSLLSVLSTSVSSPLWL